MRRRNTEPRHKQIVEFVTGDLAGTTFEPSRLHKYGLPAARETVRRDGQRNARTQTPFQKEQQGVHMLVVCALILPASPPR